MKPSHMDNHLNAFFGAMSDPTRRAVIERLVNGPATVSELAAPHDMALPSFLKHLKKLEEAGLLKSEKVGRVRTVHLEAAPLAVAEDWLARQRLVREGRFAPLQALADRT